nr:DUF1232 domain-containing protein [uncultured Pseudomonas sp.]
MKSPWNFSRYLSLAQGLLSRGRLPFLLQAVVRKSDKHGKRFSAIKDDLRLLQGLCLAWWRGEYRAISYQALVAVVAGLVYLVMPLDGVPDWLLGVGFIDDLAVLAWVLRTWREELQAFRVWRDAQTPEQIARLEHLPDLDPAEG